ncbi:FAD binding domain-containing protein [Citreicella sp. C3M06]|uniref:FAD binding domain-containing protein n=1 Tax=Citreicella sp. C3M06 TaxID=2841564 RepID=UPI001C0A5810|nr:FAD binding domain-containing protein [Citreicella sp. C3M06]MBU2961807.1 FAD binding domain-containing protein [Citreicella sp. C3M06]
MTLHRPESLEDALALSGGGAALLAGGTDLYPGLRDGAPPPELIDLTRIASMKGITRSDSGWRIGGATTWTAIVKADLPPMFDGLKAAAREVGSVQIQNAGTLAGNLCNASPAADGVPALLALDASVELASAGGTRVLPLEGFILGPRRTALEPGEILSAIHIPDAPGQGAFLKLGARKYLVISIAMVAATVTTRAGRIETARIAVGACSPVARRLSALETQLVGATQDEVFARTGAYAFDELSPIDDVRASAGYRLDAVTALVARTVANAMETL